MYQRNIALFFCFFVDTCVVAHQQPVSSVMVSESIAKRWLQPWKKWLIGGSVTAAAVIAACLAWHSKNTGVTQKPILRQQKEHLLKNDQQSSAVVGPEESVTTTMPSVPSQGIDYQEEDRQAAELIKQAIAAPNNKELTNLVQQLYQQEVDADVIDKVVLLAKVDRVEAQKMLVALPTIFYVPYPVTAVKSVEAAPECVICMELEPVSYLFCSGDGKVLDVYCAKCWFKGARLWVQGKSSVGVTIKDMMIAVLADHIDTYKSALDVQIKGMNSFLDALQKAQDRSFIKLMDQEKPCSCTSGLGEKACQCALYRQQRTSFTPQQRLQEALVVGGLKDASNNRKIVAKLAKELSLVV